MPVSKLKAALEEKKGTMKDALVAGKGGKPEGTVEEELSENGPEELKEETQGGPEGKTADQMIEENLVILMNLDHKSLGSKELATAIAHLAVTTLVLKKAIDVLAAKDAQLAHALGQVAQGHQDFQNKTATVMQGMHNRLNEPQNLPPQAPAGPVPPQM